MGLVLPLDPDVRTFLEVLRLGSGFEVESQVPPVHRLLHLLGSSTGTPPIRIQIHPQTTPQVDHPYPIRRVRFPSSRRVLTIPSLSYLSLPLSRPKTSPSRALRLCKRLDGVHSRLGYDYRSLAGEYHQWARAPYSAPPVFHR